MLPSKLKSISGYYTLASLSTNVACNFCPAGSTLCFLNLWKYFPKISCQLFIFLINKEITLITFIKLITLRPLLTTITDFLWEYQASSPDRFCSHKKQGLHCFHLLQHFNLRIFNRIDHLPWEEKWFFFNSTLQTLPRSSFKMKLPVPYSNINSW